MSCLVLNSSTKDCVSSAVTQKRNRYCTAIAANLYSVTSAYSGVNLGKIVYLALLVSIFGFPQLGFAIS